MRTISTALTLFLAIAGPAAAQAPEPPPAWDTQAGASFVGTSGNSDTASTGADFSLHKRWPLWRFESTASAIVTNDQGLRTAERYLGTVRGERKLSSILGLSAGWRAERDRFAGIDFRSVVDGGLSWALLRRAHWTMDGLTSIAWNHEQPTIGDHVNDPIGVLQAMSKVSLGTGGESTQRFTFYPNFDRGSAYRSEAEVTAQAAMNSHLALKFGYLYRRSNEPVTGFEKTDNTTTASIVLRWRAATTVP